MFPGSDNLLDDGRHDQIVPSLSSPGHISPRSIEYPGERYSRKVFVGGLPPDIDEGKHILISVISFNSYGLHYKKAKCKLSTCKSFCVQYFTVCLVRSKLKACKAIKSSVYIINLNVVIMVITQ